MSEPTRTEPTRTERHETVWEGRLTGAQFRDLVLDGLRRAELPCLSHNGVSIELTLGDELLPSDWPDVHYSVTQDELWWRKPQEDAP